MNTRPCIKPVVTRKNCRTNWDWRFNPIPLQTSQEKELLLCSAQLAIPLFDETQFFIDHHLVTISNQFWSSSSLKPDSFLKQVVVVRFRNNNATLLFTILNQLWSPIIRKKNHIIVVVFLLQTGLGCWRGGLLAKIVTRLFCLDFVDSSNIFFKLETNQSFEKKQI